MHDPAYTVPFVPSLSLNIHPEVGIVRKCPRFPSITQSEALLSTGLQCIEGQLFPLWPQGWKQLKLPSVEALFVAMPLHQKANPWSHSQWQINCSGSGLGIQTCLMTILKWRRMCLCWPCRTILMGKWLLMYVLLYRSCYTMELVLWGCLS